MKRFSEVVLNGHPDKFCDLIADSIIREIYKSEPDAYAQIEVSVWSDVIFLTGGIATRNPLAFSMEDVIRQTGINIGYTRENHIDVSRYKILNHICMVTEDPRKWTNFVNDQSIVVGYAGYDAGTHFLPPEHFVCWYIRESITLSMQNDLLAGHGPDGKILVIMNEEYDGWYISKILVTMQQNESVSFIVFTQQLSETVRNAYMALQQKDKRWKASWNEIDVLINPNGPLLNGGSDGDNGQTGRKLVMDFYGPRIPIGGGALSGKDLSHIDRLGAYNARKFALHLMACGAKEALVKVCYAPGIEDAIQIDIVADKRPQINQKEFFNFSTMKRNCAHANINYDFSKLGSFYNEQLDFNKLNPKIIQ
jgi:S-adenosylmethionine synthetase